jgi:hypothetical protein
MQPFNHQSQYLRPPTSKRRDTPEAHLWCEGLPKEWQEQVIAPLVFEIQREYEVAARRVIGKDEDDAPCYCDYRYALTELCCDDADVFFEAPTYAEELTAWRLRDTRWLIRRRIITRDDCESARAFYCLSENMPR